MECCCLHCLAARATALGDRRGPRITKDFEVIPGDDPLAISRAVTRRRLLGMVGAAVGAAALATGDALAAVEQVPGSANQMRLQPAAPKRVWLHNVNTGETFNDVYWLNGRYLAAGLRQLNVLLRDHHTGAVTQIDPRLFDILARLHYTLRLREPLRVVSAYRSPETNLQLYMHSSGVAENSFHIRGMAVDVMSQSRSSGEMTRAALAMHVGGVGNYRGAPFIHVDSGPLRTWTY